MAATQLAKNRKLRQDALREMLSKKCTVQQVLGNIQKMEEQGETMDPQGLTALKYATDTRLKLINKYIPDMKSIEVVDEDGNNALPKSVIINVVDPRNINT